MKIPFDTNIKNLAQSLPVSLYAVGGYVRNFIISGEISSDLDICSTLLPEEFCSYAVRCGFNINTTYKRTGTVVIEKDKHKYEYSVTRSEEYSSGGEHTPINTVFGVDIEQDAIRRDFKCNAVYYDIKNDEIVDCLGGVKDIENRVLSTVIQPEMVFCHDGLRLMRLARFAGELAFSIEQKTLHGAKAFAKNIVDISPERIADELKKILVADNKYSFSAPDGHYRALKVLDNIGVLDYILPELVLGRSMPQRSDFHKYDVLEHSLRCVLYADKSIRLVALLHDVGKPERYLKTGKYHGHADSGEDIAKTILNRYRFDKKTVEEVATLVKTHMADLDGDMRVIKVRKLIVKLGDLFEKALLLKTADFRAGQDVDKIPPTVEKWEKIYNQMIELGTPFNVKGLKITAYELIELGYKDKEIGVQLDKLFNTCIENPSLNQKNKLLELSGRGKI